jgi:hypothetical protein
MTLIRQFIFVAALGFTLLGIDFIAATKQNSDQLAAMASEAERTNDSDWFIDVTARAGIHFRNLNGDPEQIPIIDQNGQGAAFLDYDNDGWLDLYLLCGSTIQRWKKGKNPGNRLYRNNGNGTFTDVTEKAGVRGNRWSVGCAAADYDGDGFVDLYGTNWGANVLYHNNGDGTFSEVTKKAGVGDPRWSSAAAFGDVDKDGDLDLYVSNYVKFDPDHHPQKELDGRDCNYKGVRTGCSPLLYEGETSVLYRNNGDGTFTDVTEAAGIGATAGYRGFGAILADFDLDEDLDLYVGCDVMPNLYFLNRGNGTPTGVAFAPAEKSRGGTHNALGKHESSMGVAIGDVNDDGFPDIFCTNFADEKNTLYQNLKGVLGDVSAEVGLAKHQAELGWGTVMADFDNDSFLDIFIANGHIYPQVDQLGLAEDTYRQPQRLYRGTKTGNFREAGEAEGWRLTRQYSSRGVLRGDYDNDGDMDVLIVNHNDRPTLLQNERGGNFLAISLKGAGKNTQGIGARAAIRVAGRTMWRFACPHQGYQSSQDPRLHFGLGDHTEVDEIVVYWPGGTVDRIPGPIAGNRFLTIKEGKGLVKAAN